AVDLICVIPEAYPMVAPEIEIEIKKGLGSKNKEELLELLTACANDNLEMPSIYTIVEAAREWLVDNNVEGQDGSMYAEMMRRMQQKDVEKKKQREKAAVISAADSEKVGSALDPEEEERIRKRQAGHPVTMEVFMEWKVRFEQEMRELRMSQGGAASVDRDDKPTGKQLFLSNRAGLEEALIAAGEQETGAQLAAAMTAATRLATGGEEGEVSVSEDLFLDDVDDDEDLNDLLDDEDEDEEEDI
ncbi:unnamed protein product, partial [Symbiodinium microadriaticum]